MSDKGLNRARQFPAEFNRVAMIHTHTCHARRNPRQHQGARICQNFVKKL